MGKTTEAVRCHISITEAAIVLGTASQHIFDEIPQAQKTVYHDPVHHYNITITRKTQIGEKNETIS